MTSNLLLGRALGALPHQILASAETSRLLHSLQAAPSIRFDGSSRDGGSARPSVPALNGRRPAGDGQQESTEDEQATWAHKAGVNTLTIDPFEGRYLLTGASSSSVSLWDLESACPNPTNTTTYRPLATSTQPPTTPSSTSSSSYGITALSFYPFDTGAFLRSSYDHTLSLYATEPFTLSATFDLGSVIYSHAVSPIATHLLVACATQLPAVRLVDLRSGASAQQLSAGSGAAVLACAWSPTDEHILASGHADGVVKLWDVRRGQPWLGVLDLEDSVGIGGEDGFGKNARERGRGRAHAGGGGCNGLVWTEDGRHLVSAGHDERVRVWDVAVGANALSHFGPGLKNPSGRSSLVPLLVPGAVGKRGESVMVYPNERELLMFDLFEGTLLKRLKVPGKMVVAQAKGMPFRNSGAGGGAGVEAGAGGRVGERNIRNRITALAWRAGAVEIYSSHSDGVVRAWKPKTRAESELDREEEKEEASGVVEDDGEDDGRKRKRQALDDVFRELTKQKITFT